MNSITGIIVGLDAILFIICGIRIFRAYSRSKDKALGDFAKFFIFGGAGFIIMLSASAAEKVLFLLKLLIIIGLFFVLMGMAYFTKLTAFLNFKRFDRVSFWVVMIFNFLTVVAMTKFYLLASNRAPFLDSQTKALVLNFPAVVTLLLFVFVIATMILPGIIFLVKSFRTQDKGAKLKGMFISLGLFFFALGFMSCSMSRQVFSMKISHIFFALAFMPFLAGVFYVTERKLPEIYSVEKAPSMANL
jgi:hypothetical protein